MNLSVLKKLAAFVLISIATHYVINHVPTLHDNLAKDYFPKV